MIEQDQGSSSARRGILVDRTATAVDITKTAVVKIWTAVDRTKTAVVKIGTAVDRTGILVDRTATAVDRTKTAAIKIKTAVDTIWILLIEQQQQLTEQKQL